MNELILVVEDSRTQAMLLENILQGQNYEVVIVDNGEKAMNWLSENNPSLVITDIVMPGMNGYELCRQIKTQKPTNNIPVILLTSLNGTEEVIEGLVAGADSFITKPFDQDFLISHIEKILADHLGIDSEKESFGVEILFEGKKRIVQADQQQTIKLLLNIYEGAIQRNTKLLQTQEQLKSLNENLESIVDKRTLALSEETIINKQIAEKLKESEENWRKLVTNVPDYIALHDCEGKYLFLNHYAEGFSEKDTIGKSIFDYISDESKVIFRQNFENCLNSGKNHSFEYTAYGDNRTIRNYETTFVPNMQQGKVSNVMAIARDITDRKQAEENLVKYKTLLTETELMGKIGGWEFDVDTMEQSWTDETFRILEIDLTHGTPKVPEGIGFIDPDYRSMAGQAIQRAIEFGEPYDQEWPVTTAKGNKRWIHTVAKAYEEQGKIKTISGSFQDITDRKHAEEVLKKSEEKFRKLLENLPLPVCYVDKDGVITYRNDRFIKIFGYTDAEVPSLAEWWQKAYPDEQYRQWVVPNWNSAVNLAVETGTDIRSEEYHVTCKDGSVREIIISGLTINDNFLAIFIDITERKKIEDEIKLKNAELLKVNAEKDKFFSIIAHDLRGPLSSFLGLTRMMSEDLTNMAQSELEELAATMEKSASSLFRLLDNLLEWAKMQQGLIPFNPVTVHLYSTINDSIEIIAESIKAKEIKIAFDIAENIVAIADKNMLQTIIRNLISNAVKFTHKGGQISLSGRINDDKNIEISIKDSGIGMSPAMLGNLFQMNTQTNRKGTEGEPSSGLGLLLCKEFIEKLGGKIWVESEEGKGSTFYFTLPV